jgi:hypothetical protein
MRIRRLSSALQGEPHMSAPDSAAAVDAPWPELDRCFLQKDRRAPPPFPLDVIPAAWRLWIAGHAQELLLWQVPTSPASILAVSPTTVDPGCVRRPMVRTSFLSRFRSVFSRLSQGPTATKCRGTGFWHHPAQKRRLKTAKTVDTDRSPVAARWLSTCPSPMLPKTL